MQKKDHNKIPDLLRSMLTHCGHTATLTDVEFDHLCIPHPTHDEGDCNLAILNSVGFSCYYWLHGKRLGRRWLLSQHFRYNHRHKGWNSFKTIAGIYPAPWHWLPIEVGKTLTARCNHNVQAECGSGVNSASYKWVVTHVYTSYCFLYPVWKGTIPDTPESMDRVCIPMNSYGKVRSGLWTIRGIARPQPPDSTSLRGY